MYWLCQIKVCVHVGINVGFFQPKSVAVSYFSIKLFIVVLIRGTSMRCF